MLSISARPGTSTCRSILIVPFDRFRGTTPLDRHHYDGRRDNARTMLTLVNNIAYFCFKYLTASYSDRPDEHGDHSADAIKDDKPYLQGLHLELHAPLAKRHMRPLYWLLLMLMLSSSCSESFTTIDPKNFNEKIAGRTDIELRKR